MGVSTRPAERRDAEAIRAIYNAEVTATTVTFDLVPRTLDDQIAWIDARSGGHVAIVAETDGELVGFGSLSRYHERAAYAATVESSVYVDARFRERGVGRALLEELLRRARSHGFHTVMARIAGGHEASTALHAACGFEMVGTEREVGRKFGRWLDVVVMQRML